MNLPRRKIVIACYEVPGWGGASTASYKLFELLQSDGLDVYFVNIIGEHDIAYFEYRFGANTGNPRALKQVYNCPLAGNNYKHQDSLYRLIEEIDPELMVAVGWIAAYTLGLAQPSRKLIYMTTGCDSMKKYIRRKKGNDFLSFERDQLRRPRLMPGAAKLEKLTLEMADLIVAHSTMNLQLHQAIFPGLEMKIYANTIWFSEWIYQDALSFRDLRRPFGEREIDVLFICNTWSRQEKNFHLARKVIIQLRDLNVHVVGEVPAKIRGVQHRDFISDRDVMFELMGNSKVVVCTSSFDAAPGILFEASAMECNVVASRNCGNWQLCNRDLLVDPVSVKSFRNTVRLASTRKFSDNIAYFEGRASYDDLKDLLSFF